MRLNHSKRKVAAAAAAGCAVALLAAPAAHAEVVNVTYRCEAPQPVGTVTGTSPIDITAEKSGSSYKITMTFKGGVSKSPLDLPAGIMTPSATIKLGGAQTGTVAMKGIPNTKPAPKDQPIQIDPLTGTYKPGATGKVTFTPDKLVISAAGTTTNCTPTNNPKPSLTLDVTDASGGTSDGGSSSDGGGSSTSGGSSSSGGSSLPKTGPADSAVALGTLGGTVLLAGTAGVLWVTRRRAAA